MKVLTIKVEEPRKVVKKLLRNLEGQPKSGCYLGSELQRCGIN